MGSTCIRSAMGGVICGVANIHSYMAERSIERVLRRRRGLSVEFYPLISTAPYIGILMAANMANEMICMTLDLLVSRLERNLAL